MDATDVTGPHTGAMIALIPSEADAAQIAVDGGEPADELHLTLYYLGKAAAIDESTRTALITAVTDMVERRELLPVEAQAFAPALFNPDGEEPCWVLLAGDDPDNASETLGAIRGMVSEALHDGAVEFTMPEPRTPWFPHVTLAYTGDTTLAGQISGRTGPIRFDRLRIAFGGQATDIPLAAAAPASTLVEVAIVESGGFEPVHPDDLTDAEPLGDDEQILLAALDELDGVLVEVFDAGQARYPKGHPKGGQWRPMVDRVKDSIAAHRRGEHGDKHPLHGYSREQLRRVAKARGIELRRGEDRDSIAAKLLTDLGGNAKAPKPPPAKTSATPAARKQPKVSGARMEPITRREFEKIKARREHDDLTAQLQATKDPREREDLERKLFYVKKRIDQKSDEFYNWESPHWDEQAAARVIGTPSEEQIQAHVDKVMPQAGMSAELREELSGELSRQGETAPRSMLELGKIDDLSRFDHGSHGHGVMAYYNPSFRSISMNPRWDSDRGEMDEAVRRARASGWWVHSDATGAAGTAAHEFGHHVFFRILSLADRRQRTKLTKALDDGLGANGWLVQHVRTSGDIKRSIDAWLLAGGRSSARRTVSEYGAKDGHELTAEVWREYTTSKNPRPHIKAMGDALRHLAEELDMVRT
ncbi:hypothetical protein Drose_06250 [Dactylosporangium roseum]|uniref:Uncharacterized protein n=1 Tax=Dactylosporangium roseum TaxID=47989 RepID=A0ABY5ZA50_9ACTN|nr:hypothetical protein [Dactylosporangium roseum]UWZ37873.1 hypothetical protein Drose_06250 [Dactylosporangium roseum]